MESTSLQNKQSPGAFRARHALEIPSPRPYHLIYLVFVSLLGQWGSSKELGEQRYLEIMGL